MMKTIENSPLAVKNHNGYVLVTVLLFMLIVSIIGIAANHTSAIEIQIAGNDRAFNKDFYDTDGQLIDAIEQHTESWLNTDDFLAAAVENAKDSFTIDLGEDGVYTVEVRCIEPSGTKIEETASGPGLSKYANDIPLDAHTGPPPPDFFYSARDFAVRRFAVTVRSADDRTVLQAGVWKAFPRQEE